MHVPKKSPIYQGTGYWTRLKLRTWRIGGQGKPLQVELFLTAALQIMLCNYGLGASSPRAALGCNSRTASCIHLQYFFYLFVELSGVWVRCILLFKSSSINWGSFNSSSLTTLYFLLGWKSRNPKNSDLTAVLPKPNHTFHNLPYKLCIFMDTTCILETEDSIQLLTTL